MPSRKRPKCSIIANRKNRKEERPKRSDYRCRCGKHNRDKKRILWKQGRHKSNKAIKYKECE